MKPSKRGHPIKVKTLSYPDLVSSHDWLHDLAENRNSCLILRDVLSPATVVELKRVLMSGEQSWASPNAGMKGGEIRTIGAAATPTFTALSGPSLEQYRASAANFNRLHPSFSTEPQLLPLISKVFSKINASRPAMVPAIDDEHDWLPFNIRALPPGEQIYAHHDNHYRLSIYDAMDPAYDRSLILSWFLVIQSPEIGGVLKLYGLWGSDPNPPILPTRFLDVTVLEHDYLSEAIDLNEGDFVVFNSGKFVHRVTEVSGSIPRLTLGGFATMNETRTHLAFWS